MRVLMLQREIDRLGGEVQVARGAPGWLERLAAGWSADWLLAEYQLAYEEIDAAAVARLVPSTSTADLTRSFSQLRSYKMRIIDPRISITGDTAAVTAARQISAEPKVGTRQNARTIPTVFKLKKSGGAWIIESVEEQR
jgi:hypothetical protein